MKEKEEEIQLYQMTNIDKTKDQSAGHLDPWLMNDTLRTLLLTMDWVFQFSETFPTGVPGK